MQTAERLPDLRGIPVDKPYRRLSTWTVPLAGVVAAGAIIAVTNLGPAQADRIHPTPTAALSATPGESYVVAGGQAPTLETNLRSEVEPELAAAAALPAPHIVAGGQAPVLSTPSVLPAPSHIVSGGQAPVWSNGSPIVEPQPAPAWKPTRDKPGGR